MENVQSRRVLDLLKVGDAQLYSSSGTLNVSVTTTTSKKQVSEVLRFPQKSCILFLPSLDVPFPFRDRSRHFALHKCKPEAL